MTDVSNVDPNAPPPVDPNAVIDPPATEPPKQPDMSWVPGRISEITAKRRAAEERAAKAEADLAALRASHAAAGQQTGTTPAPTHDIEALARSYAEKMVRDRTEADTINSRIAAINDAGVKEFGADFQKSIDNLTAAGIGGPEFLRVIANVPNAEKLVTWMGKAENLNDAMRVVTLDPVQMGIEMTKLSTQAAKDLGKQISKAPPPAATIDGRGAADGAEPDSKDTAAWMAWRVKNKKTRR